MSRPTLFVPGPGPARRAHREDPGRLKAEPLSAFLGQPTPAAAPAVQWVKPLTPAEQRNSREFFNVLNFVLQFCPTHPSETALRERFARVGIVPGKPFDAGSLSKEMKAVLEAGMADGQKAIDARRAKARGNFNDYFGTRAFMKNDYVARAVGSQVGIGANSKEEALWGRSPCSRLDSGHRRLSVSHEPPTLAKADHEPAAER